MGKIQSVEEPTWRWDGAFVYITFKRPGKYDASLHQDGLKSDSIEGVSIKEHDRSIGESIQESIQELKSNRDKVLLILSKKPSMNLDEVAQIIGISRIGVQKIVGKLKSEGILYRDGSTKAGKWIVNKNVSS